jgi:spermidine/putrescine-binding protein
MDVNRRTFIKTTVVLAATGGLAFGDQSWAQAGQLNWITYGVYALPDVLGEFEKRSGTRINPVITESPTAMLTRLRGGAAGQYDLIHGDALWPNAYFDAGLTDVIDLDALESSKGLYPVVRPFAPWKVQGGSIAYPGFWGTSGIMYVPSKVPEPKSWEALLDPKYRGRIIWRDKFDQMIPMVAQIMGVKKPYELSAAQLKEAKDTLAKAKPNIKSFALTSGDVVKMFSSGEADIGYAASAGYALRALRSGLKDIAFTVPREGTIGFLDGNCVVKSSSQKAATLKWIDYYYSPEVHATVADKIALAPCSAAAVDVLEKRGQGELVQLLRMRKLEEDLSTMALYQPPANIQDWINAWNEIKGS